MNNNKVAIFWDYENCPVPAASSGHHVVKSIRGAIQPFGCIKLFKAYLAISDQTPSRSPVLRSELQASGVSLTDTPHNGSKDVADKMIIVDMMLYAIDNPAPATVVLISGDRDFAYAVSSLRLRQYDVVIVSPPHTHVSLTSHATALLNWRKVVLADGFQPSDHTQSPLPPSQELNDSRQTAAPDARDEVTLEDYLELKLPIIKPPAFPPPSILFAKREPSEASATAPAESRNRCGRVDSVSSSTSFASCLSAFRRSSDESESHGSGSDRWTDINTQTGSSSSPGDPPSHARSPPLRPLSTRLDAELSESAQLHMVVHPSRVAGLPSSVAQHDPEPLSQSHMSSPEPHVPSFLEEWDSGLTPTSSKNPISACQGVQPLTTSPPSPSAIPKHFKPLIRILQGYCAKGDFCPFRPSVATEVLTTDSSVLDAIPPGQSRVFSNYSAMAVSLGVVEVGGSGGDAWITLHPRYRSADLDTFGTGLPVAEMERGEQ